MRARPLVVRLVPVLDFGGVESRVTLQSQLSAGRAHDLRVCTFDTDGAAADAIRASGCTVDNLGVPARLTSWQATRALIRYLQRVKPDLVHSSIVESNTHACVACAAVRIPLIVEEVGQPSHSWKARVVLRALYRIPTTIIGVSKVTCRYLVEHDGAPRDRTQLVYNCASPRFFPRERRTPRVSAGPLRILVLGRLHPIKNQATLLRAVATARNAGLLAHFDVVGTGPAEADIHELARSLHLEDRVHFHGFRDDVEQLFEAADGFVLPSLSEGCSISLIEAMASAVPCMGSNVPGIVEVLGEFAARWTFGSRDIATMADTLLRFERTPSTERARWGRELQERAYTHFSPEVYLARLDDIYTLAYSGGK